MNKVVYKMFRNQLKESYRWVTGYEVPLGDNYYGWRFKCTRWDGGIDYKAVLLCEDGGVMWSNCKAEVFNKGVKR